MLSQAARRAIRANESVNDLKTTLKNALHDGLSEYAGVTSKEDAHIEADEIKRFCCQQIENWLEENPFVA